MLFLRRLRPDKTARPSRRGSSNRPQHKALALLSSLLFLNTPALGPVQAAGFVPVLRHEKMISRRRLLSQSRLLWSRAGRSLPRRRPASKDAFLRRLQPETATLSKEVNVTGPSARLQPCPLRRLSPAACPPSRRRGVFLIYFLGLRLLDPCRPQASSRFFDTKR